MAGNEDEQINRDNAIHDKTIEANLPLLKRYLAYRNSS